jgi:hypothetical protein
MHAHSLCCFLLYYSAGLRESQLPRPGETASFDQLLGLLRGIGAKARLVTDPVPFLATEKPSLDR